MRYLKQFLFVTVQRHAFTPVGEEKEESVTNEGRGGGRMFWQPNQERSQYPWEAVGGQFRQVGGVRLRKVLNARYSGLTSRGRRKPGEYAGRDLVLGQPVAASKGQISVWQQKEAVTTEVPENGRDVKTQKKVRRRDVLDEEVGSFGIL